MANLILQNTTKSLFNNVWRVDLYDKTSAGTFGEFRIYGTDGVIFESFGKAKNTFTRIRPTVASFRMRVELGATATYSFYTRLKTAEERRHFVKIFKNGVLYFIGYVMTDGMTFRDEDNPSFQVTCVDGLGFLKGRLYIDSTTDKPFFGEQTFIEHIFNCMNLASIFEEYSSGVPVLTTAVNWYADEHPGTAIDPLNETAVNHSTFYKSLRFGRGETEGLFFADEYYDAQTVLSEILRGWNAEMINYEGAFHIFTKNIKDNSSYTRWLYDKDGTQLGSEVVSHDRSIDKVSYWKAAGGADTLLPPLRKVVIKYQEGFVENVIDQFEWSNTITDERVIQAWYYWDDTIDHYLEAHFNFRHFTTHPTPGSATPHRYHFKAYIKLEDARVPKTDYWLRRNVDSVDADGLVSYDDPTWETSYYEIDIYTNMQERIGPPVVPVSHYIVSFTNIVSPVFPSPFKGITKLSIKLWLHGAVDLVGSTVVLDGSHTMNWYSNASQIRVINEIFDEQGNEKSYQLHRAINDNDNSDFIEQEVLFGDNKDSVNYKKLRAYDGADWVDADGWSVGSSGGGVEHSKLLAQEMLGLRKENVTFQSAKFYWNNMSNFIDIGDRVGYDNLWFISNHVRLITMQDAIEGIWMSVDVDVAGAVLAGPLKIRDGVRIAPYPFDKVPIGGEEAGTDEDEGIYTLAGPLTGGDVLTTLTIEGATGYYGYTGDEVFLRDPTTSKKWKTILDADALEGDTTLTIESATVPHDFPAGTKVNLTKKQAAGGQVFYDTPAGVGNTIDLSPLITLNTSFRPLDAAMIERRFQIFRNGVLMTYNNVAQASLDVNEFNIDQANSLIELTSNSDYARVLGDTFKIWIQTHF